MLGDCAGTLRHLALAWDNLILRRKHLKICQPVIEPKSVTSSRTLLCYAVKGLLLSLLLIVSIVTIKFPNNNCCITHFALSTSTICNIVSSKLATVPFSPIITFCNIVSEKHFHWPLCSFRTSLRSPSRLTNTVYSISLCL